MININSSELIKEKIKGMQPACLTADGISIENSGPDFEDALAELEQFIKARFSDKRPAEDSIVSAVRRMYRRIGWEPTRYRPSSEALIRRILQSKGLYRINNAVDYGNLASAFSHIPMGLYDLNKISGEITADVGRKDEVYEGISKSLIHAEGKLILRDQEGIFGNPTADSKRTSISKDTEKILAVFFGPPEAEREYLERTLERLADYYQKFMKTNGLIEKWITLFE
jgi:DNA/RNA-binding domain of Phe-tRNA-synthetase-like protein